MAECEGKSAEVSRDCPNEPERASISGVSCKMGRSSDKLATQGEIHRQAVNQLLVAGTESYHQKTWHASANILQVESCLWTFVRVAGVEPTNNNTERPL